MESRDNRPGVVRNREAQQSMSVPVTYQDSVNGQFGTTHVNVIDRPSYTSPAVEIDS